MSEIRSSTIAIKLIIPFVNLSASKKAIEKNKGSQLTEERENATVDQQQVLQPRAEPQDNRNEINCNDSVHSSDNAQPDEDESDNNVQDVTENHDLEDAENELPSGGPGHIVSTDAEAGAEGSDEPEGSYENVYEIEEILDVDWDPTGERLLYLVKWKDYDSPHNTWQTRESFLGTCYDLLTDAINRKAEQIEQELQREDNATSQLRQAGKRSRMDMTKEQLQLDKQKWIAKYDTQTLERRIRYIKRSKCLE